MLTPGRKSELIRLIGKVLDGSATQKEKRFVEKYYQGFDQDKYKLSDLSAGEKKALEDKIFQYIEKGIGKAEKASALRFFKSKLFRQVAAAVILLAVSAGVHSWYRGVVNEDKLIAARISEISDNDVFPGGNKAILTLSNGARIVLDSIDAGTIAKQGGSNILKVDSGQLAYHRGESGRKEEEITYNTLRTPRGGQYRLTLADGTKVWLNSASSLKFPTAFPDSVREVTLTGEAYFEVVKNPKQPFRVKVGKLLIEDLGTHFNVMAYADEPAVKTTLLEGAVSITDGDNSALLKPGQQAVVDKQGRDGIRVANVNLEDAVAWKDGLFSFHSTDIYEIMRQVSRWYDVDVSFGDSLQLFLNGNINRDVNASELFQMLALTGEVAFTIHGKTVIVRKRTSE